MTEVVNIEFKHKHPDASAYNTYQNGGSYLLTEDGFDMTGAMSDYMLRCDPVEGDWMTAYLDGPHETQPDWVLEVQNGQWVQVRGSRLYIDVPMTNCDPRGSYELRTGPSCLKALPPPEPEADPNEIPF